MTEEQINNIIIMASAMAEKAKIEAIGADYYQATKEYSECLEVISKAVKALKESI
uniref:Uncharacterized protein n=1 Tax=uncultured marine virus TaxID=186617 RepID=A0A0F7L2T7_9VIRU|nr:hypothetical protein [uncultured marine virus]